MKVVFEYNGPYLLSIKKSIYEKLIIKTYNDFVKLYNIEYKPKKFIIKYYGKKMTGGITNYGGTSNKYKKDETFVLSLQVYIDPKYKKKVYNDIKHIITHEILHFFVPAVNKNGCWTEGLTDFLAYKYENNLPQIINNMNDLSLIKNKTYYEHKYSYI